MTIEAKKVSGLILITVPGIVWGGYFMLAILSGWTQQAHLTGSQPITTFQKEMFRAGHAHAGVLVIFAILAQLLIDSIQGSRWLIWGLRLAFPVAAVCISFGFFTAAFGPAITSPTPFIYLIYMGAIVMAISVVVLGLSLLRAA